ncbi:M1 family metallopeptidase [Actinophytocola sediminis]
MVACTLVGVGTSVAVGGRSSDATVPAAGRFDVASYDITMDYLPAEGTLRGVTVVRATATDDLDSFTLHLSGPTVRAVSVGGAASFTQSGDKDLVIVPAVPLGRGADFEVRVEYDGTPGPGWLPTTSGGATSFMGSSSAWFPAHEDAHDKADFHLTATVPPGWSAVAIGRDAPVAHAAGGDDTFRWTEPAVDPAHVAVTIDRLEVERSSLTDGTPVVTAYAPGLRAATEPLADRLPEIIDFLSGVFGRYPFSSAGNVFVHVNDDGPATAPQTRPVYLGAGNARFMDLTAVVHEQAHQWYGISVAPAASADNCLSECFAAYAPWLWDEVKDGVDLDGRYREQVAAGVDDPNFWAALYRPGQTPGINLYSKGPVALHALRHQVGDQAFDELLGQWPERHRGGYVDWPAFEEFAETVTGQELTGFLEAWFRDATVPAEEYLWSGELTPAR